MSSSTLQALAGPISAFRICQAAIPRIPPSGGDVTAMCLVPVDHCIPSHFTSRRIVCWYTKDRRDPTWRDRRNYRQGDGCSFLFHSPTKTNTRLRTVSLSRRLIEVRFSYKTYASLHRLHFILLFANPLSALHNDLFEKQDTASSQHSQPRLSRLSDTMQGFSLLAALSFLTILASAGPMASAVPYHITNIKLDDCTTSNTTLSFNVYDPDPLTNATATCSGSWASGTDGYPKDSYVSPYFTTLFPVAR